MFEQQFSLRILERRCAVCLIAASQKCFHGDRIPKERMEKNEQQPLSDADSLTADEAPLLVRALRAFGNLATGRLAVIAVLMDRLWKVNGAQIEDASSANMVTNASLLWIVGFLASATALLFTCTKKKKKQKDAPPASTVPVCSYCQQPLLQLAAVAHTQAEMDTTTTRSADTTALIGSSMETARSAWPTAVIGRSEQETTGLSTNGMQSNLETARSTATTTRNNESDYLLNKKALIPTKARSSSVH